MARAVRFATEIERAVLETEALDREHEVRDRAAPDLQEAPDREAGARVHAAPVLAEARQTLMSLEEEDTRQNDAPAAPANALGAIAHQRPEAVRVGEITRDPPLVGPLDAEAYRDADRLSVIPEKDHARLGANGIANGTAETE